MDHFAATETETISTTIPYTPSPQGQKSNNVYPAIIGATGVIIFSVIAISLTARRKRQKSTPPQSSSADSSSDVRQPPELT